MRWQCLRPAKRARLRSRARKWAANESCAWGAWRAGICGERVRRELGEGDGLYVRGGQKAEVQGAHFDSRILTRLFLYEQNCYYAGVLN